jgi:hypothetical protein
VRRSGLILAGLAALLVAGVLAGCVLPVGVGWSPYPGTEGDSGWTPYVPTSGETVDPSVVTLVFTGPTGGAP